MNKTDRLLYLFLKHKKPITCIYCGQHLVNVRFEAKARHTITIPNIDESIEIKCPVCKSVSVFSKKECIDKKVHCLKCNKIIGQVYPGMPDNLNPLGKNTVFYRLKIICPNSKCSQVNEIFI